MTLLTRSHGAGGRQLRGKDRRDFYPADTSAAVRDSHLHQSPHLTLNSSVCCIYIEDAVNHRFSQTNITQPWQEEDMMQLQGWSTQSCRVVRWRTEGVEVWKRDGEEEGDCCSPRGLLHYSSWLWMVEEVCGLESPYSERERDGEGWEDEVKVMEEKLRMEEGEGRTEKEVGQEERG
ncbi:Hypothetical predicted protein [Xyrichtys novacula]|uniref:Uncharacterized protein n=1 Tax=Xyrichtys novacula TaxID=13765 RepID=A0AAV1FJF8_XYRNO|nr:Hypothetical predicted protein [Xyrichtys novacula]